ncbi:mannose-1-phosphate guanylyltransferase/mannose-6-phosphate isomerase, partial [Vibrio cholerae O1]|nr:mannose-1-phosphate guanylyltransferase/mannose-6-phosphate isomerase [Vibrio cholerae O1]
AQQLQEAGLHGARVVLEPVGRNTAPALTLAALVADADDVLLAMPADHVIRDLERLHHALNTAWQLARQG